MMLWFFNVSLLVVNVFSNVFSIYIYLCIISVIAIGWCLLLLPEMEQIISVPLQPRRYCDVSVLL